MESGPTSHVHYPSADSLSADTLSLAFGILASFGTAFTFSVKNSLQLYVQIGFYADRLKAVNKHRVGGSKFVVL